MGVHLPGRQGLRRPDRPRHAERPGCPLSSPGTARRVIGVDACKGGWVGICLDDDGGSAAFGTTMAELLANAGGAGSFAVVAIDIPIGLPDASRREADGLAKLRIGKRRDTVFMTPTREALAAPDHASANVVNRRLVGEGLSIQAYGLRHRIFEVERWLLEAVAGPRVFEVHPEVCFAELAGGPLQHSKSRWAGCEERRDLLAAHDVTLRGGLGTAGARAAVDDILDAAVAAWTAQRVRDGSAVSIPDPPEVFSDGPASAMWI